MTPYEREFAFAQEIEPQIRKAQNAGHTTPAAIAKELSRRGYLLPGGAEFTQTMVARLIRRLDQGYDPLNYGMHIKPGAGVPIPFRRAGHNWQIDLKL